MTTKRYINSIVRNIWSLILSKEFIGLSIIGNTVIFIFASIFFHLEFGINPHVHGFIDALWFAFSTVTTVGYGDITPQTYIGKVLGIFMMLVGTALFVTFTALFSNAILGQKISSVEGQITTEEEKIDELIKLLKYKK
jgi:voltage-gated potassium channel